MDGGRAALAQGLVHYNGTGDRDVERGDLAGHGDSQKMIAGLLDQVMETGAFASENEDAVGGEGEVGVVGGSALVKTDDPDVGLLHLFEGADEVRDAGDADVFGGSGGGFGDGRGDRGAATLGKNNAVDPGSVGGSKESAQIVRIFHAIESEEESVMTVGRRDEKILNGEESPLAKIGDDALMGFGFGDTGELIAGFDRDTDASGTGEGGEAIELCITSLASDGDPVEATGAGSDGLFDGMEAIENVHEFKYRRLEAIFHLSGGLGEMDEKTVFSGFEGP